MQLISKVMQLIKLIIQLGHLLPPNLKLTKLIIIHQKNKLEK